MTTTRDSAVAYLQAVAAATLAARAKDDATLAATHQQAIADLQAAQSAEIQALAAKRAAEDAEVSGIISLLTAYVPADASVGADPQPAAA